MLTIKFEKIVFQTMRRTTTLRTIIGEAVNMMKVVVDGTANFMVGTRIRFGIIRITRGAIVLAPIHFTISDPT